VNAAAHEIAAPRWVSFALDAQRFALPLAAVSRIVRAVEITPLPLAPGVVAGALDVAGRIMPVYDLRRRLRLPERPLRLDDQLVIAHTARRPVAMVIDRALGIIEAWPRDDAAALEPHLRHLRGVLSQPDGLVLIQDLEDFLSPEEDAALESALRAAEVRCTPTS
jgi:purine-binding chemotaxis protein CheW